jgi:hypothetical protein
MEPTKDFLFAVLFDVTKQMQLEFGCEGERKLPDSLDQLTDEQKIPIMRICELLVERGIFWDFGTAESGLRKAYNEAIAKYGHRS